MVIVVPNRSFDNFFFEKRKICKQRFKVWTMKLSQSCIIDTLNGGGSLTLVKEGYFTEIVTWHQLSYVLVRARLLNFVINFNLAFSSFDEKHVLILRNIGILHNNFWLRFFKMNIHFINHPIKEINLIRRNTFFQNKLFIIENMLFILLFQ